MTARPRDLNAWLVLLLLAFPETFFSNLDWTFWPEPWYLLLAIWRSLVQVFVLPALLWFGFLFPERWRLDLRLPWFKYVILAVSCCAFVAEFSFFSAQQFDVRAIRSLTTLQLWTDHVSSWLYLVCILLFLVALFDKLRSASMGDATRRLRVLAIGSALSLGPLVIIFTVLPWLVRTLADQAAQRERMNREIEIAREVQQRLSPQSLPRIPGVDLAGRCRPASEVGGDYYDLIEMEGGHLGFAIGDVSGKGISAALIMASLRASLRGLILDDPGDLARMMQKVSHLVYEASSSSRYATFFFATLNPRTREFRYVNAGHNPPVLVKQASGALMRFEDGGPVVGMLPFAVYEAQSITLEPGDLLIAYTDGISEAMTVDDEEWGESRMLAAVPPHPSASAAEILDRISSPRMPSPPERNSMMT